jgi:NADPH2:quinone reductase
VGENAGFAVGDRAATFGPKTGAYATERNLPGASLFRVPDAIDDATAAAVLLKGCTTEFLIERCARVQPGWDVLVHAAAGGVGLLLVQWLKHIGARVIGTVSTPEKAAAARAAGADEIIVYTHEPVAPRVRALTGGNGVQVVFDGVGMTTWEASLDSTARRGLIVSFGNAGGPVRGVDLGMLAAKGSLFCSRRRCSITTRWRSSGPRAVPGSGTWCARGSSRSRSVRPMHWKMQKLHIAIWKAAGRRGVRF